MLQSQGPLGARWVLLQPESQSSVVISLCAMHTAKAPVHHSIMCSCCCQMQKGKKRETWSNEVIFLPMYTTSGWDDVRFHKQNQFEWQQHLRGENPKETSIFQKVFLLIQQAASLLQGLKRIKTVYDTWMSLWLSQIGEKSPKIYTLSYAKQFLKAL